MNVDCTAVELVTAQAGNNLALALITLLLVTAAILYFAHALSIPAGNPAEEEDHGQD